MKRVLCYLRITELSLPFLTQAFAILSACDESTATRAYWQVHQEHVLHGVVGCRCSGETIAVARIAGLQGIPQVSPTATSSRLSESSEFPFFSRMVAPDNGRGEVGAVISLLREFGWDRVTILNTDTQYAKDLVSEFKKAWLGDHSSNWTGEVAYSNTITLDANGGVDPRSASQALDSIPVDEPTVNSRVVLLVATEEHAFSILEAASKASFQPDTVYVGLSWIGAIPPTTSWLPSVPGYLGVTPFIDRDSTIYQDFFRRLLQARGVKIDDKRNVQDLLPPELNHWAVSYTVDSIVSMVRALSDLPPEQRLNGTAVTEKLRNSDGQPGITGEISLTKEGDRQNPQYTVLNYQTVDGNYEWVEVGRTGTVIGSVAMDGKLVCFAGTGCGVDIPDDSYPVPNVKLDTWVLVVIPMISIFLVLVACKYWRSRLGKRRIKENMTELERKMLAIQNIDDDLVDIDKQVEAAKQKKDRLIMARMTLKDNVPETWTDSTEVLVEVEPHDAQYWNVTERLQETMEDAHISKLWRIQNAALWSYYSFHKDRLSTYEVDTNEQSVWHGTSALDPSAIYKDRQDGFMMQYNVGTRYLLREEFFVFLQLLV